MENSIGKFGIIHSPESGDITVIPKEYKTEKQARNACEKIKDFPQSELYIQALVDGEWVTLD